MVHDVYFAISENSKNRVLTLSKKFGIKIKLLQIIKQVELPFKIDFYLKNRFDWIVFTSSFGVKVFSEKVMKTGAFHYLLNTRFAAVGQETANMLRSYGFGVDFVPEHFTTDELASKIPVANGAKILTVRSKQG
ncbi:MAG: uroporphyrinogen-III synthase, partial [Nitrososphaeria archaeon]